MLPVYPSQQFLHAMKMEVSMGNEKLITHYILDQ